MTVLAKIVLLAVICCMYFYMFIRHKVLGTFKIPSYIFTLVLILCFAVFDFLSSYLAYLKVKKGQLVNSEEKGHINSR